MKITFKNAHYLEPVINLNGSFKIRESALQVSYSGHSSQRCLDTPLEGKDTERGRSTRPQETLPCHLISNTGQGVVTL